jgi:hypothetical protein
MVINNKNRNLEVYNIFTDIFFYNEAENFIKSSDNLVVIECQLRFFKRENHSYYDVISLQEQVGTYLYRVFDNGMIFSKNEYWYSVINELLMEYKGVIRSIKINKSLE